MGNHNRTWKNNARMNLMIDPEMSEKLNQLALDLDVSKSTLVRKAITMLFDHVDSMIESGSEAGKAHDPT